MIVPEYAPGQWHAVVGGGVVALLAPSTAPQTVRAVWDAIPAHGGLTDQLEVLLRGGISGLLPFALVDISGGRVHAALRGDVEVEVSGAGGTRVLAAGEVTTWSERVAEGADVMTVRVSGGASTSWPATMALPLSSGVVLADGVRVALVDGAGAPQRDDAALAPAVAAAPSTEEAAEQLGAPEAALGEAAQSEATQSEAAQGEAAQGEATADVPPVVVEPTAEHAVEPTAEPALTPEAAVWATELEDVRPQGETAPDEPASAESLIVGAPAWLLAPVSEPAAPVAFEAPAPAPSDPFRIDQLRADVERVDSAEFDGTDVDRADFDRADLERTDLDRVFASTYAERADVAAQAEAATRAPVGGDALAPDDHDGLTILSSDLVAIRDQLPSWAGDEVPGPFRVVAPEPTATLRLVLSTGAVVPLDRSVLLGRAPQVLRVTNSELPRLVSVPSPQQDISRTHAEVRTEGEDVLVTDLQSTNGVLVSRQGERARRLHPGEPTLVRPGELVDLGDGVTFTVERGT